MSNEVDKKQNKELFMTQSNILSDNFLKIFTQLQNSILQEYILIFLGEEILLISFAIFQGKKRVFIFHYKTCLKTDNLKVYFMAEELMLRSQDLKKSYLARKNICSLMLF